MIWRNNGKPENTDNIAEEQKIIPLDKILSENSTQGNKIYFYTDVTKESVLVLNKQIDDLTRQMKITQLTYNLPFAPPIELHICSDGGDVFAAMASVDKIMSNSIPIHTFIEGAAASASTLLSVSGTRRFITKNSCALLHQVSGFMWGDYAQINDEHANFTLIMNILKSVYLQKTKFKKKELDELLKHDLYLDSSVCLKKGLVDKII